MPRSAACCDFDVEEHKQESVHACVGPRFWKFLWTSCCSHAFEWISDCAKECIKPCESRQNAEIAADVNMGLRSSGFSHFTSHLLPQKPSCTIASSGLKRLLKQGSSRLRTHRFIFPFLFALLDLLHEERLIGFETFWHFQLLPFSVYKCLHRDLK